MCRPAFPVCGLLHQDLEWCTKDHPAFACGIGENDLMLTALIFEREQASAPLLLSDIQVNKFRMSLDSRCNSTGYLSRGL